MWNGRVFGAVGAGYVGLLVVWCGTGGSKRPVRRATRRLTTRCPRPESAGARMVEAQMGTDGIVAQETAAMPDGIIYLPGMAVPPEV